MWSFDGSFRRSLPQINVYHSILYDKLEVVDFNSQMHPKDINISSFHLRE